MTAVLLALDGLRRHYLAGDTRQALQGTLDLLQAPGPPAERAAVLAARAEWMTEVGPPGEASAVVE